jgi:hypothetical protein
MTAKQIVTLQIEAYNNRDLEGNMALFSDSFKIINFSDGSILIDGKEACREMYASLFANSPELFAEVISRIDFDNKVVLHEYIFGKNGSDERLEQLLIFEVNNQKIERIFRL